MIKKIMNRLLRARDLKMYEMGHTAGIDVGFHRAARALIDGDAMERFETMATYRTRQAVREMIRTPIVAGMAAWAPSFPMIEDEPNDHH